MSATFRSLGIFNYRLWFAGATVSNVGTWMQRTAQDWVILTELTDHDAVAVGIGMALQFGPILLLTPVSGLVADLVDRRKILIATQIAMGALSLALGILFLAGVLELWMVFLFAGLLGVISAFDNPARQAFVSELVPHEYTSNAIGLNGTSFTLARLIGPGIAGLLTATTGAGWVFLINFGTFLATIIVLVTMRRDELVPVPRREGERARMRDGARFVGTRPDIGIVLVGALVFGAFAMNFAIFTPTMTSVEFGLGATEFGILSSCISVGSITGALLGARRERPTIRIIAIGALAFGLLGLVAAIAPSVWVYGAIMAGMGVASMLVLNTSNAYVQTNTPAAVRGRVMAIYAAVVIGSTVFGAPLVGWVADVFGPRWAVVVGAAGGLVPAVILGVWWAVRRGRARRDAREAAGTTAAEPSVLDRPEQVRGDRGVDGLGVAGVEDAGEDVALDASQLR
ncbi:MAG: MFS transporter [Microbacteriaceae bacterium]|nr:MFS transporter [Microbacteriaceae bacterium]